MRLAPPTLLLALALFLPGCTGGGERTPATQPSPSAAAQGGAFTSTADILSALGTAGLPCAEPMSGTFEGVTEAQSCILNDAEDVVLLRFADDAEKQAYVDSKDELSSAVVGDNWAVQTVLPQTAEQVAGALGGEVLLGEGGEQPTG